MKGKIGQNIVCKKCGHVFIFIEANAEVLVKNFKKDILQYKMLKRRMENLVGACTEEAFDIYLLGEARKSDLREIAV